MHDHDPGRTRARTMGALLVCAATSWAALGASARDLVAQLPGLPSAQSAFPAPGLALALDGGHADGRTVPAIAGATGVRRLQLTVAAGLPGAVTGYERDGVSLGGRLAARLYRTPTLGVSAFAGYGFERMQGQQVVTSTAPILPGAVPVDTVHPVGRLTEVPVGISAGVRGLVADRPYAVSIAPMYAYSRWAFADSTRTRSGLRVAALAELAVTPQIGLGVGAEVGSGGPVGSPYAAHRTTLGAGLSYAIHRVVAR